MAAGKSPDGEWNKSSNGSDVDIFSKAETKIDVSPTVDWCQANEQHQVDYRPNAKAGTSCKTCRIIILNIHVRQIKAEGK